ncbi:MAG: hypothetical protein ONB05_00910 [candidate division KSB1 bacterium]|nr:hypothetical protein [candidate division KSB1 bacterium]
MISLRRLLTRTALAIVLIYVMVAPSRTEQLVYISRDTSELSLQESGWYLSSDTRNRIPLNGFWEVSRNEKKGWHRTIVPCIYNFEGEVLFRKQVMLDSSFIGRHFKLVAYGINHQCSVFINGKFIGSHAGGYSSFAMDIEDGLLQAGQQNQLLIRVNNHLDAWHTLPLKHRPWGWKNYGGIYRDLFLIALPKVFIEEIQFVQTFDPRHTECHLAAHLAIRNLDLTSTSPIVTGSQPKGQIHCYMEVWKEGEKKPVASSPISEVTFPNTVTARATLELKIPQPQLWSPEQPFLYQLKIILLSERRIIDVYQQPLGLKDLQIFNNDIFLNGQRLILNGVNWYEDYAYQGTVAGFQTMKQELTRIKELGVNSLRIVGHPAHPYLLELCNQYGLLVFQEIPAYWLPAPHMGRPDSLERAQGYLQEMILRDRNLACLAAWGLGSGLDLTHPGTRKFISALQTTARGLDLRPTYLSSSLTTTTSDTLPIDIIGLNLFARDKLYLKGLLESPSNNWLSKPLILFYGYPLFYQASELMDPVRIEAWQAYQLDEAWKAIHENTGIDGSFLTAFADWQGDVPALISGPYYFYPVGLMNSARAKRISYQVIQARLTGNQKLQISEINVEPENPSSFPVVGLGLIIVFLFFYKRERRLRKYLSRTFIHPHGFNTDLRENRKIPAFDTFLIGLLLAIGLSTMLASLCFYYKQDLIFDQILNLLLVKSSLKETVVRLVWQPKLFILVFALLILLFLSLIGLGTRILAFLLGKKLPLAQAVTFSFWTATCYLLLIPLVLFFYRLLQLKPFFIPALVFFNLFHLWFLIRLFKGLRVLYFMPFSKMFLVFTGILLLLIGGMAFYFERTQALFEYLGYYLL